MEITREQFESVLGVKWPEPEALASFPDMKPGMRFSKCIEFNHQSNNEVVHFIRHSPQLPSREVPTRFEKYYDEDTCDEEEYAVEWRTLSDAEYADAMAKYEKALAAFHEAGGAMGMAVLRGVSTADAKFVLEDGSIAKGRYDPVSRKWLITEWSSAR